ncbi:MAG TPA: VOC family protein [Roseiflexaceae bacterium]|nr:VOC family protein [Roseiflexaceae bacterium]
MQAVWIEIPVKDLDRALSFYQAVFKLEPTEMSADDVRRTTTLVSTTVEGAPGISLNQTKNFEPSDKGTLVYLDVGGDLSAHLDRVETAGGKIVEPKTSMGDAGFYATFRDTEGNVLALYSYK